MRKWGWLLEWGTPEHVPRIREKVEEILRFTTERCHQGKGALEEHRWQDRPGSGTGDFILTSYRDEVMDVEKSWSWGNCGGEGRQKRSCWVALMATSKKEPHIGAYLKGQQEHGHELSKDTELMEGWRACVGRGAAYIPHTQPTLRTTIEPSPDSSPNCSVGCVLLPPSK